MRMKAERNEAECKCLVDDEFMKHCIWNRSENSWIRTRRFSIVIAFHCFPQFLLWAEKRMENGMESYAATFRRGFYWWKQLLLFCAWKTLRKWNNFGYKGKIIKFKDDFEEVERRFSKNLTSNDGLPEDLVTM